MEKTAYDPADTDYVVSAANYLETSEFTIFQNAYQAWYGGQMAEKELEKMFILYLQENRVPFWVRNYARSVVPAEIDSAESAGADSRLANNLLYLATVIAEYTLLACYLFIR